MRERPVTRKAPLVRVMRPGGFTLVELLVVIAIIGTLSSLLLPTLARARNGAQGISCLNNTKQLTIAWLTHADDHDGRLANNFGGQAARTNLDNWVAGALDWELTPDNTNSALLTEAALGSYVNKSAHVYRCPSDKVLSSIQRGAGWRFRVRSYSMNASVGDAGEFSSPGYNINNPDYVQFFKMTSIRQPSGIFVFLDEHPNSIGDGYFLNKVNETLLYQSSYAEWLRLPASYHNGASAFSFADGHSEIHRWQCSSTKPSPQPEAVVMPIGIPADQLADFRWILDRMSVDR